MRWAEAVTDRDILLAHLRGRKTAPYEDNVQRDLGWDDDRYQRVSEALCSEHFAYHRSAPAGRLLYLTLRAAQKETFREFFVRKYGPYPGITGEPFDIVTSRIANALADWADEIAKRAGGA